MMSAIRPWSDVPSDILGLFLEKLHYVDQIRFRAVCKSWRVSNDLVKCSDNLPWVMSLENYPSSFQLFDPHSRKSYRVINNQTEKFQDYNIKKSRDITVFATKQGWLLLGKENSALFLHNPFSNEAIFLPFLYLNFKEESFAATFTGDPKSPDCEIIVLSNSHHAWGRQKRQKHRDLFINRYRLSTDTEWTTQYLETMQPGGVDTIHYMNGQIYCLMYSNLTTKCYNLADKSWNLLEVKVPENIACYAWEYRLTDKDGSLLLVLNTGLCTFEILSLDWSSMCWAVTDTGDSTFFLHEKIIFSPASVDNGSGCSFFYLQKRSSLRYGDPYCFGYAYNALKNGQIINQHCWAWELDVEMKRWMHCRYKKCIIEPPYVRNSSSC